MRTEWLPASAAALVVGSAALFLSSLTIPRPSGDGTVLQSVVDSPDTWLTPIVVLLIASVGLIVGMPCLLSLFPGRGSTAGYLGTLCLAVGTLALCGFAHQMAVLRSMSLDTTVDDAVVASIVADQLQSGLLQGGFVVFYLGEVLLAIGLTRAGTVPKWVTWAFWAHLAVGITAQLLDTDVLRGLPSAVLLVALVGVAFYANLNGVSRFGRARSGAGARD